MVKNESRERGSVMDALADILDANGFPLWISIVALLLAGIKLSLRRGDGGELYSFDVKATMPLRGVLTILVMLGHLKVYCPWSTAWFPWVSWATPAVAVFFFMSGYGLCKSATAKGASYLSGFLPRSLCKLIIPLAAVVVLYSVRLIFQGRLLNLFLQFLKDGNTPVPNTWYVYALCAMYVAWYVSWRISATSYIRLGVLSLLVLSYFCLMEFVLDWNYVWARTIWAFPLGALFAQVERSVQKTIRRMPFTVYVAAAVLLALAIFIRACVPGGLVAIAGRGLTSTLGLWLILVWYAFPIPGFKLLNMIGKFSYEIYLIHGAMIAVLLPITKFGFGLFSISVVLSTLVLSIALHHLVGAIHRR